ncbi:MAG: hypothetical protein KTR26_00755, partial [Flammeovirgaceae bacterium]|nr:hypothetical protein [Flammeovirgaceae bacterium]
MRNIFFGAYILLISLSMASCNLNQQSGEEKKGAEGEKLAHQYCGSCHAFPQPELLIKSSWENYVLPRMGYMLGIYSILEERNDLIEKGRGGEIVESQNIFPEKPIIDVTDWEKIKKYYLDNAP